MRVVIRNSKVISSCNPIQSTKNYDEQFFISKTLTHRLKFTETIKVTAIEQFVYSMWSFIVMKTPNLFSQVFTNDTQFNYYRNVARPHRFCHYFHIVSVIFIARSFHCLQSKTEQLLSSVQSPISFRSLYSAKVQMARYNL